MGCCSSKLSDEQKTALQDSNKLDKVLTSQTSVENRVIKLLLLGTGSSGKSTIFKQMQIIYQEGFSDFEKSTFRHVVRRNIVECLQALIDGAQRFRYSLQAASRTAAQRVMDLDPLSANFWTEDIVTDGAILWKDPAIQATYEYRSRLQLLDSCDYLMRHLQRIGAADFTPNAEDILRARLRTSGIVERMFEIHSVRFKFLDVGGQRNERRKWIHCFEGVTAVIFLTAICEYDQNLYEDEKVNRLHESLQVFESICNNKYFTDTAMILFLNKIDLFNDKVNKISIRICFPDYEGPDSYEPALKYIEDKFLEQNKQPKLVFTHPTCATDTRNVEKVFDACRLVILKENLEKLGLS